MNPLLRFWLRLGIVIAFLCAAFLVDSLIKRSRPPCWVGDGLSVPFQGRLAEWTKAGRNREQLLPIIQDASSSINVRVDALNKLAEIYAECLMCNDKALLLRYGLKDLGAKTDTGQWAKELMSYYAGEPPASKMKPNKKSKEQKPPPPIVRNEKELRWTVLQQADNLRDQHNDAPRKLSETLVALACEASRTDLPDTTVDLVREGVSVACNAGVSAAFLAGMTRTINTEIEKAGAGRTEPLIDGYETVLKQWTGQDVPACCFQGPAKWHKIAGERGAAKLAADCIRLLKTAAAKQAF